MKKMFVAFGIAIAVFCGMIFGTSQPAQAAEIDTNEQIKTQFEEVLNSALDDYSDEYDKMGITNVDATVYMITLPGDRVMFLVIATAEYQGEKIWDVQVQDFSMSEIELALEAM